MLLGSITVLAAVFAALTCVLGSFSGAAEALNYTQSGISQMMAGLEEELEVRLFARV